MEAMERTARIRQAQLGAALSTDHPVQLLVRFGDVVDETVGAAREVGAVFAVTPAGRRGSRVARAISRRLDIPVLPADEEQQGRVRRRDGVDKTAMVKSVPILAGLRRSGYMKLAQHLDEVSVEGGTVLLHEGHRNRALWVVVDGEVELTVGGRPVRRFGPGSVLGATSMLDRRGATASAVALTPVKALVAGPSDFQVLESDPEIDLRLKAASREVLLSEVRALAAA
jgi:hypothetical protein